MIPKISSLLNRFLFDAAPPEGVFAGNQQFLQAAGIINGISGIGGIGLGIGNIIANALNSQYQQQWQRYVYEDQKRLNDPAYIMERRRAAGLNPYGDFSQGLSTGQPQPVGIEGVSNAINGLVGSLSNSADKSFQFLSNEIARKSLELQNKKLDNEIELTDAQAAQLRSSTVFQDIANEIAESTKGSQIELSNLQVQNLLSQILLNGVNLEWLPKKLQAEINKLDAETNLTNYNWESYYPAMLALQQRLGQSSIDVNKKNIEHLTSMISVNDANVKKIAQEVVNLKVSNSGFKELQRLVGSMKDGPAKSFMTALMTVLSIYTKR